MLYKYINYNLCSPVQFGYPEGVTFLYFRCQTKVKQLLCHACHARHAQRLRAEKQ